MFNSIEADTKLHFVKLKTYFYYSVLFSAELQLLLRDGCMVVYKTALKEVRKEITEQE